MKTIRHTSAARDKLLHIEADGCIINIQVGLHDRAGQQVTSVEIIPDDESRGGDGEGRRWHLDGHRNNRIIRASQEGESSSDRR